MTNLDFNEIAQLINFSRTTYIHSTPSGGKDSRWVLYRAEHRIHTSVYPFTVLYLHSGASQEDIKAAARAVQSEEETHVVYPPSLAQRHSIDIKKTFKNVRGVWTTKEYLASFIENELKVYLQKLEEQAPQFYTDPRVEVPAGVSKKTPNPLLNFLRETDTGSSFGGGKLGILLAEPGQGKTYMSRHLVSEISGASKNLVPLMVDSTQWNTMPVEDLSSLAKTIAHSFRHFEATIGWLDGHEDPFLRATLKAEVFRIVFDGFDEYVLRNRGTVQPMEVLEALAELAITTGTRIVITSRTSFWNTNLIEDEVQNFLDRTGSLIYKILPFDIEHAKNYFKVRLSDQRHIDQAIRVYNNLRNQNEEFVGRGFVLSLIADLIERSDGNSGSIDKSANALLWLMEALCEREILRQNLPFTVGQQLQVFRTFATEVALGVEPDTFLLEYAMRDARPKLDDDSLKSSIDKFKSHPLIERNRTVDQWSFKQEQIGIVLLAFEISNWPGNKISDFVRKSRLDASRRQDLGITIVDLIKKEGLAEDAQIKLESLIKAMSTCTSPAEDSGERDGDGCRLAAVVALNSVERFLPKGSPHQERRALLLHLLGGTTVEGLSFSGTIARFDFKNVTFDQCRFERVTWANCKFDNRTVFRNCRFIGGTPPAHCEGFGSVTIESGCRLDPEAEAVFNNARVSEGKRQYSVDDLRNDIRLVVNKFIVRGGGALKNVEDRNLTKGPIGASRHRDDVIENLCATVIEEHPAAGNAEMWYSIRKEAVEAVKFYAANNVFTGPLQEGFESLHKKIFPSIG